MKKSLPSAQGIQKGFCSQHCAVLCYRMCALRGEVFVFSKSTQPSACTKVNKGEKERKQVETLPATQEQLQPKVSAGSQHPRAAWILQILLTSKVPGAGFQLMYGSAEASSSCRNIFTVQKGMWPTSAVSQSCVLFPGLRMEGDKQKKRLSGVTRSHLRCPTCDNVPFASSLKLIF